MWNPKILEIIIKHDQNSDDILVYLLSLHYGLKPSYVPDIVKKSTNIMGIVNRDFERGKVKWILPLFNSQPQQAVLDSKWDWVQAEYRELFRAIDPKRGGDKQSCLKKMQKFFAQNPDVRKDDIIRATNSYLDEFKDGKQDPKFLIHADYFIKKLDQSRLAQYVELLSDEDSKGPKKIRGLQDY